MSCFCALDKTVGNCTVQRVRDVVRGGFELRLLEADPVVRICDRWLAEPMDPAYVTFGEGILKIEAANGTVHYELVSHCDTCFSWMARRYRSTLNCC